jgi:cobaltochelatase CobS
MSGTVATPAAEAVAEPVAAPKAAPLVLKDGETTFSGLFGIKEVVKDFGVTVLNDSLWDVGVRNFIPNVDPDYVFPPVVTEVVVSALVRGKRSQFVHGPKGSGKSTLMEQVCAKLRIPFFRVNMAEDAEGSRLFGAIGAKAGEIVWREGPAEIAATARYDGVLKGCVLQVDEVSAAPAGINLNMQWMLERNGKIMLGEKPEGETLIHPGPSFHVYCTDNTVLQGDTTGKYVGTNVQNEAFLDRMSSVVYLGYLSAKHEFDIITNKTEMTLDQAKQMRALADLVRAAYDQSKVNFNISPRGLVEWGEEAHHWGDMAMGFKYTFFNKLTEADKPKVNEMYRKVFGKEVA